MNKRGHMNASPYLSNDPWWNLGAAIVREAIANDDIKFMKSEWCSRLEKNMGLHTSVYNLWKYKKRLKEEEKKCRQNCKE